MKVILDSEAMAFEYEIASADDVFFHESAYFGLYSLFIRPVEGQIHVVSGFYTYGEIERIKKKISNAFSKKKDVIHL